MNLEEIHCGSSNNDATDMSEKSRWQEDPCENNEDQTLRREPLAMARKAKLRVKRQGKAIGGKTDGGAAITTPQSSLIPGGKRNSSMRTLCPRAPIQIAWQRKSSTRKIRSNQLHSHGATVTTLIDVQIPGEYVPKDRVDGNQPYPLQVFSDLRDDMTSRGKAEKPRSP